MSDANLKPPSDLEPERLIAAVPPASIDAERLWNSVSARLADDEAAAPSPAKASGARGHEEPIRRRWWIEVLTGIAAFFLFALMLGNDSRRISVKHTPIDDGKSTNAEEPDPAPLLEQLKTGGLLDRRKAYLTLLRGGKKTREAVSSFKTGGDTEQDLAVANLRSAFALVDQLAPLSEKETLAFWQSVWNAEASLQSNIWDIGLDLPQNERPGPVPSPLLADAMQAKYGEAQGLIIKGRFAQAYTALLSFHKWERHKNAALLDSIEAAGITVAPVVLHVLSTPEATTITVPRRPGMKGTFPSDHLRMMVAAVKLNLHEAEPLILQFTGGYFSSPTIQGNAINALWRLGGRANVAFPLDIAMPSKEEVQEVQKWWHENHKDAPKGKFDDDINAYLSDDLEKSEQALLNLLRGGDPARAAVRAHVRAAGLQRAQRMFEFLATLDDDTESLDFWKDLWNDEAELEPWLWAYGIKGEGTSYPSLEERPKKPKLLSGTPELLPVLRAKFGDPRGQQIARRFADAYQAYVNFRNWSRPPMGESVKPEMARLLDAMAAAGIAVAPPILKLLSEPVANNIENEEQEKALAAIHAGRIPPLPTSTDHLRMIVAADRLKLRAAELLIVEKVALRYPLSRTIQEHAIAMVYRLHGDREIVKNFPFDLAMSNDDFFGTFYAFWLEEKTASIKADLASGDAVRIDTARETVAAIRRMLPLFEEWQKRIADDKKFPEIAARLAEAIDVFKQAYPGSSPPKRESQTVPEEPKQEQKKKDEGF